MTNPIPTYVGFGRDQINELLTDLRQKKREIRAKERDINRAIAIFERQLQQLDEGAISLIPDRSVAP